MTHLVPEQRSNIHGHLVTKHVRPPAAPPVPRSPMPPVNLSMAPPHLQYSFEAALTLPKSIRWEKLSKEDVTKIADYASNEMEFTANAEGMLDLYTEMFKSEHLDSKEVLDLMKKNDVLKRVKSVFMEANGMNTDDAWTQDQYDARNDYMVWFAKFNAAAIDSGAVEVPITGS